MLFRQLYEDDAGFIVSAELVLVATILVLGLIVGLSEIQYAVVQELNDVANAIGRVNQSYRYTGFSATKTSGEIKSSTVGSRFRDQVDVCDFDQCDIACDAPLPEGPKF